MNSLSVQTGVAVTTITRLARTDEKAASALSLNLAPKVVTVLQSGSKDLLEVVEVWGVLVEDFRAPKDMNTPLEHPLKAVGANAIQRKTAASSCLNRPRLAQI